jgi:ABC-type ATPase involved in cell division
LNKLGTTVVIATHNRVLMDRIRQPALVLKDGQLTETANGGRWR